MHGLWAEGDRILAAVSGGPDSLALLLTLHAFSRDEGFFLECCCVDHRLRTESAAEAQFVQRVCRSLGVHCTVCTVDVGEEQRRTGDSLETAARSVRYRALRETARTRGMTLIATAHHGDDQAETVLYHMIRGSGPEGLEGICPRAGDLIRPFLCVRKEDIRRFLRRFPYTPCHDPTNDEQNCTRNRIRLSLLPAMREYNPRITDSLCRLAEVLREENRWMDGETEKFWNRFGRIEENRACFPLPAFRQCGTALQRRILRWAAGRLSGEAAVFDYEETERFRRLLLRGRTGSRTSAAGIMAEISYGEARFYPGSTRSLRETDKIPSSCTVREDGIFCLGPWEMKTELLDAPPGALGPDQCLLDADRLEGPVTLRCRRPGDRFSPAGMDGSKTIKKIMIDMKIPKEQRDQWPLAADDRTVYWIGGRRRGRGAEPDGKTVRYLLLTLRRITTWTD